MAYTNIPMDFSQSGIVQQENYPHQQVYDFATPFGHQTMPVYSDYPDMVYHQHADHSPPDSTFWHIQGSNSGTAKTPLGSNGKPKRRRTATQAQRRAANVRERRRMFNLNESFDQLRTRVPTFAYEKRLSRIETLRLAITYISFLGQLIDGVKPDDVQLLAMPKTSDMSRVRRALGVKDSDTDYYDCLPSDSNSES